MVRCTFTALKRRVASSDPVFGKPNLDMVLHPAEPPGLGAGVQREQFGQGGFQIGAYGHAQGKFLGSNKGDIP